MHKAEILWTGEGVRTECNTKNIIAVSRSASEANSTPIGPVAVMKRVEIRDFRPAEVAIVLMNETVPNKYPSATVFSARATSIPTRLRTAAGIV
jgi:hypothetical protein